MYYHSGHCHFRVSDSTRLRIGRHWTSTWTATLTFNLQLDVLDPIDTPIVEPITLATALVTLISLQWPFCLWLYSLLWILEWSLLLLRPTVFLPFHYCLSFLWLFNCSNQRWWQPLPPKTFKHHLNNFHHLPSTATSMINDCPAIAITACTAAAAANYNCVCHCRCL